MVCLYRAHDILGSSSFRGRASRLNAFSAWAPRRSSWPAPPRLLSSPLSHSLLSDKKVIRIIIFLISICQYVVFLVSTFISLSLSLYIYIYICIYTCNYIYIYIYYVYIYILLITIVSWICFHLLRGFARVPPSSERIGRAACNARGCISCGTILWLRKFIMTLSMRNPVSAHALSSNKQRSLSKSFTCHASKDH